MCVCECVCVCVCVCVCDMFFEFILSLVCMLLTGGKAVGDVVGADTPSGEEGHDGADHHQPCIVCPVSGKNTYGIYTRDPKMPFPRTQASAVLSSPPPPPRTAQ